MINIDETVLCCPADMGRHTKIHFILMFGPAMLYDCQIEESFRHVVSDQLGPYFLLDIFRLVSMKIAQSDGIFQLAERPFYGPSGKIDEFYTLRRDRREELKWEKTASNASGLSFARC